MTYVGVGKVARYCVTELSAHENRRLSISPTLQLYRVSSGSGQGFTTTYDMAMLWLKNRIVPGDLIKERYLPDYRSFIFDYDDFHTNATQWEALLAGQ